jgi:hypothetical protein
MCCTRQGPEKAAIKYMRVAVLWAWSVTAWVFFGIAQVVQDSQAPCSWLLFLCHALRHICSVVLCPSFPPSSFPSSIPFSSLPQGCGPLSETSSG